MNTKIKLPVDLEGLRLYFKEEFPVKQFKVWERKFYASISEGTDLSLVWPRFVIERILDDKHGYIQLAHCVDTRAIIESVQSVLIVFQEWVRTGKKPDPKVCRPMLDKANDLLNITHEDNDVAHEAASCAVTLLDYICATRSDNFNRAYYACIDLFSEYSSHLFCECCSSVQDICSCQVRLLFSEKLLELLKETEKLELLKKAKS